MPYPSYEESVKPDTPPTVTGEAMYVADRGEKSAPNPRTVLFVAITRLLATPPPGVYRYCFGVVPAI